MWATCAKIRKRSKYSRRSCRKGPSWRMYWAKRRTGTLRWQTRWPRRPPTSMAFYRLWRRITDLPPPPTLPPYSVSRLRA